MRANTGQTRLAHVVPARIGDQYRHIHFFKLNGKIGTPVGSTYSAIFAEARTKRMAREY